MLEGLAELHEAWHAAEPDQGYDTQAAEWRAELGELDTEPRSDETSEGTEPTTQPAPTP